MLAILSLWSGKPSLTLFRVMKHKDNIERDERSEVDFLIAGSRYLKPFLKSLRNLSLLTIISIAAYALGATGHFWKPKSAEYDLADAIPPSGLLIDRLGSCVEPNERERALVKVAVDALTFSADEAGFLAIGAEKFLSRGLHRESERKSTRVCDLTEEYDRAAQVIRNSDHFRRGRVVEYQLELIARLPGPREDLAEVVAASAFSDTVQQSEDFPDRDIRPLARATLAGLGPLARPYANIAFAQITIEDSMGTGAAQVAIAGEHPAALQTAEKLMADKLATLPKDRAVPRDARNRLYEMAYALSFGGVQAKQHLAPLQDLMNRKVQSWAPPFGMIELPPRRMCRVLARILNVPTADLEFRYCADAYAHYEQ